MYWISRKQIGISILGLILVSLATDSLRSDISLPKIFSDHMVLQRNAKLKIWGTADAGQKLIIRFADIETKATANNQGHWQTVIQTPGAGGPYQLQVSALEGDPKVVFSDVMVGEVWICAGQSNMQWEVSQSLNSENEIDLSKNYPQLRLFSIDHHTSAQPLEDFSKVEPWQVCSPETVKNFSATAYFFGREVFKELKDVPIGLVDASWEGTVCEAWTPQAGLEGVAELAPLLKYANENLSSADSSRPASVYNGMISPLNQFPVRGVIWYQGEANNGRGKQYGILLPTLIESWRKAFGDEQMPFYFVQLASYRYKNEPSEGLAEIWDAQLKTLKSVPHTGMVVTTDISDLMDINPKNKQEIGRRLALIALANVYQNELPQENRGLVFSGPIYESKSIVDGAIELTFKHVDGGLKIRNDEPALTCFTICGADKKFVPATAKIVDNTVVVSADDVKQPTEVRFGWSDIAQPNLINAAGLPASPFRTDDFTLQSEGRDF